MEEADVRALFARLFEHMSPEEEFELRHPDYVMEMPQSGERIRGRENMRSMQENVEFRDGKILRETRYYADPFEAPEWRDRWVESMEGL
jgi:ketosteroid isomerase-like protein